MQEWLANKKQEEAEAKGVETLIKSEAAVNVKTEDGDGSPADMETNEDAEAEEGGEDDDAILEGDDDDDTEEEGEAEEMVEETAPVEDVEAAPAVEEVVEEKPVAKPKARATAARGGRGRGGRKK